MQRIFIKESQIIGSKLILDPTTMHHLFTVCRLRINDSIEAVVNQSRLLHLTIQSIHNESIEFSIKDQWSLHDTRQIPVSLIQSLPKQDKLTDICKMCSELGVHSIYPVVSDFCDVKILSENKFKRSQNAIKSAAKQSKQVTIPTLHPAQSLQQCLESINYVDNCLKLVAYENTSQNLNQIDLSSPEQIIIAIGPEGGFSHNDISEFKSYNFIPFTLGDHILRTEHAGFASICYLDGYFASLQDHST